MTRNCPGIPTVVDKTRGGKIPCDFQISAATGTAGLYDATMMTRVAFYTFENFQAKNNNE